MSISSAQLLDPLMLPEPAWPATWQNQPVTILGLSKSGVAAARYLHARGARCFISETVPASPQNQALRDDMQALGVGLEMGGHTQICFTHSPFVIVSPGIPPHSDIIQQLLLSGKTLMSEVELAVHEKSVLSPEEIALIGITGTNGKTTVTTLISKVFEHAGLHAPACGNIGLPILDVLGQTPLPNALVAELSSFQLAFSPTLQAKVAILTNFKPDHLDWHGCVEAYLAAKARLFTGKQSPEWAILPADDPVSASIAANSRARIVWFSRTAQTVQTQAFQAFENKAFIDAEGWLCVQLAGQETLRAFRVNDLQIFGAHNEENVLMAVAAGLICGIPAQTIAEACQAFQGVEHRLEFAGQLAYAANAAQSQAPLIKLYNDSKATNPDATISALRAFGKQSVILIAGGRDKHTPLDDFVQEVRAHASAVVLLGEAAERFEAALQQGGFTGKLVRVQTLPEALAQALKLAEKAEPVLFSPACASFDMFQNFEDRGRQFKQAVQAYRTSLSS